MSVQVHLKNLPSHIMEAALTSATNNSNVRCVSTRSPLAFPLSKSALWDPTPMGDTIGLHLGYYRNPRLLVLEKVVRLAYLHAKSERKKASSCFLLGSLLVDEDEEGITLTVDRFDPGREATGCVGKVPTAAPPGDIVIPCTVKTSQHSSGDITWHTSENSSATLKCLQNHICSRDALDVSKLLAVQAVIVYTENMDHLNFDLHWSAVTMANVCESIPVKPVTIIPTALARNLSSNINIAHVQGKHKSGYLTMDQTRKLLLVLDSDPKVYTLPLVGIWLSGVIHVHSPQVWACCLRYLYSSSLQERVLSETGSFLIVLYSQTHKEPEFYECLPCSGNKELSFQLLNCSESLHLYKNADVSHKSPIQYELSAATQSAEIDFFNGISKDVSLPTLNQRSSPNKLSASDHDSGVEDEDFSPRPTPSPHPSNQQVSRIHPSVPELSIVFDGSFVESKARSKHAVNVSSGNPLSPHSVPVRNSYPLGNVHNQNQCFNIDQQNFVPHIKEHSVRRLSNQSSFETPSSQQSTMRKSVPTTRKSCRSSSSSSSSSSPSTPRSGVSPDASVLQQRMQNQHHGPAIDTATPRRGPPPIRRSSPHSRQAVFAPPSHVTLQNGQRPTDRPCSSPISACGCYLNGHIQYCPSNMWHGVDSMGSSSTPEIHSDVPAETSYSVLPQNLAYPNVCCSPVCVTSSPTNPGHQSKRENCFATTNLISPRRMHSSQAGPCSASCAAHSACMQSALPAVLGNGMMGLPPDAYRLLAEQDRQLKLLQAQIQRLLEAQALQSSSTSTNTPAQRQVEFIAMETQSTAGLQMTKSVSIAVSTGASLFWNSPCIDQEDSASPEKQNVDNADDLTVSVNLGENISHATISSSFKAVDICSFAESTQDVEDEPGRSSDSLSVSQHLPYGPRSSVFPEHTPSEEIKGLQTEAAERVDKCIDDANKIQQPVQTLANVPADQILYQDLLGQVNHLLKASEECGEPSVKSNTSDEHGTSQSSTKARKRSSQPNSKAYEQNDVLSATLKQLKNLGVHITLDSSDTLKNNTNKVENASVLACINPEAVIPRLNHFSFDNVGMSGFSPNGVDLSMEANAIALKYLNGSQLSQLSQSRTSQNISLEYSSFQSLLNSNTEKSMVGLSLISPSDMSFATKKYMKRYGLIESNDSSDDEDELSNSSRGDNSLLDIKSRPNPEGLSCRKVPSEEASVRLNTNVESPTAHFLHKVNVNSLRNVKDDLSYRMILQPSDPNSLQVIREMSHSPKLLTSKAQYTRHPEKENAREMQMEVKPSENPKSLGDFLDVNRLRQLPKLF
ncbi:SCL-interrupting locus protein [Lissotriton helveticus]